MPTIWIFDGGTRRTTCHSVGGVHHCLGAVLARMEARVAIGTLVRRFPGIAATSDQPAWNGRMVLRGLDALPVTLG